MCGNERVSRQKANHRWRLTHDNALVNSLVMPAVVALSPETSLLFIVVGSLCLSFDLLARGAELFLI